MRHVLAVVGPRDAGPGERQEMLARARALLEQAGAGEIDRIDVPPKGGGDDSDGALRSAVEAIVPALQSGSLFGDRRGVMVVDTDQLLAAEAAVVGELAVSLAPETAVVCFVAAGTLPGPVARAVKEVGEQITVKKFRERDAADWLGRAARERRIRLEGDAAGALLQRFGTDVAALGQALDQLATVEGPVGVEEVTARFRNRPDEPMWHVADAIAAGDTSAALRRLADYLTHGHPLALLAFLEGDLRRRALAAAAPNIESLAEWLGSSPQHFPVQKAFKARDQVSEGDLRKAVDALARADLTIKSMPESVHRVTLERLVVALCRWYGSPRRRRAG
jgi:DNA polymerase III delta subunit